MPTVKMEEYEALFKQQPELTRAQFYDLCQDWAEKQGAKIKKEFRQYRLDEERYIVKRDRILRDRLDRSNGSDAAKNYLYELLDLQSNMNITLKAYEIKEEEMRHSILFDILKEATEIWNLLDPAHID
ncbi:unnamed protein product [Cercopithifilaria johnstoni]|uniref:Uncharacterized protein n=1 Tax=Cercopithifilaria johnstoni TaxID=2874296 RepID=A0A8J2M6N3_9BILA|nr:unnamed protein product [Cercopithifilaria johnstoni]